MKLWPRSRWARFLLVLALVIIVVVSGLNIWLKSGVGRGMVESRLSAALGRPVRLAGGFSVGFLPLPGADGNDLVLYSRDGRWMVAEAGQYSVSLSLRPLLRGEIEIVAVTVRNARLDIERLASDSAPAKPGPPEFFSIPDIRAFELESLTLSIDGAPGGTQVQIDRLAVESLGVDSRAPFQLELTLPVGAGEALHYEGEGVVTLESVGVVDIQFSGMRFDYGEWAIRSATGRIAADLAHSVVDVRLDSVSGGLPFRLSGSADWAPEFVTQEQGLAIENIALDLDDQRVEGSGCLLNTAPPQLHMVLSSEALNLEHLNDLVEGLRDQPPAAGEGADGKQPIVSPLADFDLPFELSLALDVARAEFQGVIAEGARLRAGGDPHCPGTLQP